MGDPVLVALITIPASFVGAWLAARFALSRFYEEKVWEAKTAAYTAIFAALHEMHVWFDTHIDIDAAQAATELKDDPSEPVLDEYKKAKAELKRLLSSHTWLLPERCERRLEEMVDQIEKGGGTRSGDQYTHWQDVLFTGDDAIRSATTDLRMMVREDLALEPGQLRLWFLSKFQAASALATREICRFLVLFRRRRS
jgi:hypothetical protein